MLAEFLALLPCVAAIGLPYIPTTVLVNSSDASGIYVFEPNDDATSATLISLDSSRSLTSNYAATTVSSSLPFLANSSNTAFTPFIDENGNLYVLAGDCSEGVGGTSLWTMTSGTSATADWSQASLSNSGFDANSLTGGVNYLAGGYAFAGTRNNTPTLYTFGGMCPNASTISLDASSWQASANYSRSLVMASPAGVLSSSDFASVASNQDIFNLAQSSALGGPVAEAGFSVTALGPSYSGSNESNVQQNLVLIGGHTAQAFINMSQVALLSLPQQSWSFFPIASASPSSGELIKRDTTTIEPRTGHTALLSEDGTQIIIYGGWVGDVNTPAVPQLAILSVGSGFGGNGAWQWSIPNTQGSAPAGNGVYGHGAVMLPGNTMMIVGGNSITGKGSKVKRTASQASFFNVSSKTWTSDYTNPSPPSNSPDTSDNHHGRSVGLGVGLGLGFPLFLAGLALLFCLLRRKQRRDRQNRQMFNSRVSSHDFHPSWMPQSTAYDPGQTAMMQRQDESTDQWPRNQSTRPTSEVQENGWRNMRSMEVERTGLLVDVPSPTRGLRKGMQGRNSSYYEEGRTNRRSGIPVIDEADEEFEFRDGDLGTAQPEIGRRQRGLPANDGFHARPSTSWALPKIGPSPPVLNPFADPLGSHPVYSDGSISPITPSPNEDQGREQRGWIEEWEDLHNRITSEIEENTREQRASATPSPTRSAPEYRHSPDRLSPVRGSQRRESPNSTDRTTSTLSEQSMHSALSHNSNGAQSLRRNPSQRSGHLFSVKPRNQGSPARTSLPAAGAVSAALASLQGTPPSQDHGQNRGIHTRGESGDSMSDSPGHSRLPSFGTLQAESQALLGGRSPTTPTTHLGHSTNIGAADADDYVDAEEDDEFPQRPNRRRNRNLMGSVRSVLGRGRGRASSSSPTNITGSSPTTATWDRSTPSASGTGTPFSLLRNMTAEQEPTYGFDGSALNPQGRNVSSGTVVWNRRQSGARDWDWRQGGTTAYASWAPPAEEDEVHHSISSSDKSRHRQSMGDKTITESLRDEEGGDWDVEGAIETRRVQVMFTVPRERLRVVNGAEAESMHRPSIERDKGKGRAETDIGELQRYGDQGRPERDQGDDARYKPGRGSPGLWRS